SFVTRQNLETLLEPEGVESLLALSVVVRIVCVEPVAFPVHVQICDFCELGRFDKELLLRNQVGYELDLGVVEVELALVKFAIHVWVGEKDFCRASLDDDVEDV